VRLQNSCANVGERQRGITWIKEENANVFIEILLIKHENCLLRREDDAKNLVFFDLHVGTIKNNRGILSIAIQMFYVTWKV